MNTTLAAAGPLAPFKSIRYAGPGPGRRVVVTAAVHGNEVCGTQALQRLMAELDDGRLQLRRGVLTLVPITNALAYRLERRAGDRNLNRAFGPNPLPQEFEDHVCNWLAPILAEHEGLLDLHSFLAQGNEPFVMVGPRDNDGPHEPFALAATEEALVRRLGVGRAVDGWLPTYVEGVAKRRAAASAEHVASASLDLNPRYGIGTTEYMRSRGGWALTLECGQHADPRSVEVAYRAVRNLLAFAGLVDEPMPAPNAIEGLSLRSVTDKAHADDRFVKPWKSFDPVAEGELIGERASGEPVRAPRSGRIMFPNAAAQARQEWFYLAESNERFDAASPSPSAPAPSA